MTNHPRRRRTSGDDVVAWVDRYLDVDMTPFQREILRRVPDAGQRSAVDAGKVWIAPAGTLPPADAWRNVGFTADPVDIRPITAAVDDDVRALAAITQTPRHLIVRGTFDPAVWPMRGLEDNITGRMYPDDALHPASTMEWLRVTEGRTADGFPLEVCDHCGEPVPCTEGILRHMDTDMHRTYCTPTGFCVTAERRTSELPSRT